jgi:hypothetical protein
VAFGLGMSSEGYQKLIIPSYDDCLKRGVYKREIELKRNLGMKVK